MRGAARDLCSGSGLTANRINLPNASELYPAFDWASRSPRPALCYRPLLAFPPHFAMRRVTELEPRTPHQPEKLKKLSKNDLVVRLLNFESTKRVRLYVIYFQSSAGRPQAGDRILCNPGNRFTRWSRFGRRFGDTAAKGEGRCPFLPSNLGCEYRAKAAPDNGFHGFVGNRDGLCRGNRARV